MIVHAARTATSVFDVGLFNVSGRYERPVGSAAWNGRGGDWLRSVDPDQVFLSVVTLGEIMKGVSLKARTDPTAADSLRCWLEHLRVDHARRILAIDDAVALEWGRIAAIRSRSMADALIAATGIIHGKILVTRNVSDFEDLGLRIINPWMG